MNDIDARKTLGELVTEHPRLATVFDGLGLDYCCGGGRSLSDACDAAGLDPDDLHLSAASTATDDLTASAWVSLDLSELTLHLEATHHAYLHRELPRLAALADKVVGVHGDRHPELAEVRSSLAELRDDLGPHLQREEQVLFPMIRALMSPTMRPTSSSVQMPIAVLCAEHDRAGQLLQALRTQTNGYLTPPDGCASYRSFYDGLAELEADLHLHVHKENNRLFPEAIELEARSIDTEIGRDATVTVTDLGALPTRGGDGVVWSLPHGGDLDANLVRLGPDAAIGEHRNDEVDVLVYVQSGTGELVGDGHVQRLSGQVAALIPRGSRRSIRAGTRGLTYLSIHRRRDGLALKPHADAESRSPASR
jgi:regulator of cell morphogenesis and NO signaling